MVKARKTHQPRDWSKMTGMRSGSGFIASLPLMTSARIHSGKGVTSSQKFVTKEGKTFHKKEKSGISPEELSPEVQMRQLRKSLKKCERRIARLQEVSDKHQNDEEGAEARAKLLHEQDIRFEKLKSIEMLDAKIKSKQQKQITQQVNKFQAEQIEKFKTADLVRRLEKTGKIEEERKKRKFEEANRKLVSEGNIPSSPEDAPKFVRSGRTRMDIARTGKKRFSEQPRTTRNETVIVIKGEKKKKIKLNPSNKIREKLREYEIMKKEKKNDSL